jgi:outer membrane protein assembly factor BamD (BamD/ComL family)
MNHQKNTGGDIFTLRGKSLSIKKFFLAGLWVLSILFLGGCATTSGSGAAKAGGITVCLNGRCAPADRQDKEQLIGGLLSMLKANENSRGEICSLREDGQACENDGIRWYLQGGPIPGIATYSQPYIFQVALDKNTSQIKFLMDAKARWIGTPLLCADASVAITVVSPREITMETSPVCTWLAFPGVYKMKFTFDIIDFDNSALAGRYSVAGAGLLNLGGGSNPFRLSFPSKNTLLVKGATTAVLLPVSRLSASVLSLAVPKEEDGGGRKGEVSDEERSFWEQVSREDAISGYREYLTRYPKGRFQTAARAQMQVVEEREALDRDLKYWSAIKDSKDPKAFDEYLTRFPKGAFAETATAAALRLRASTTDAKAMDAEDALWEKVKGSADAAEIRRYLDRYPRGVYAVQAQRRLNNLDAAKVRQDDLEFRMWDQIKDSRSIEDYKNYLQVYPNGLLADLAKSRLDILLRLRAGTEEMAFWNTIRDSSRADDFREYLQRYPEGKYADLSRMLVKQLDALKGEREELELWETVKNSQESADIDRYLTRYGNGRFAVIARQRQQELLRLKEGADVDFGKYFALVIGNNDYRHFGKLKTARGDAESVAAILTGEYGYQVTTLKDATRKQILDALSSLRRRLSGKDNLLIYYTGHGSLDRDTGRGYWLPVDADVDSPANWISTNDISDALKAMSAKHVMVVADSCYGGTLTRSVNVTVKGSDYLRRMAEKRTRVVLTSGGVEPVLDEGGQGHSVFARAFLDILAKNPGILEGTRLFEELRRPVVVNAPQTPEYSDILYAGHDGGDFLFVRRPNKPKKN